MIHFFSFNCGAMDSSPVSSVLYLRNADGNHAETRSGAYIHYGDAASFHKWEFRTRLRIAGKLAINTPKRCPKSVTDHVVMHLLQHKKLASITCAKLSMEDRMMRGMVYPLTEHELFRQYCRPGGHLSRQDGEIMKQYVSRRRRCWTLLVQVDPVTHVSDGHRSDMLLDLSGLTCEERVMVQASISRERDFDSVAFSTSTHSSPSKSETNGGQRQRQVQTRTQFKHSLAAENLEQVPVARTSLPLNITIMMTT